MTVELLDYKPRTPLKRDERQNTTAARLGSRAAGAREDGGGSEEREKPHSNSLTPPLLKPR